MINLRCTFSPMNIRWAQNTINHKWLTRDDDEHILRITQTRLPLNAMMVFQCSIFIELNFERAKHTRTHTQAHQKTQTHIVHKTTHSITFKRRRYSHVRCDATSRTFLIRLLKNIRIMWMWFIYIDILYVLLSHVAQRHMRCERAVKCASLLRVPLRVSWFTYGAPPTNLPTRPHRTTGAPRHRIIIVHRPEHVIFETRSMCMYRGLTVVLMMTARHSLHCSMSLRE